MYVLIDVQSNLLRKTPIYILMTFSAHSKTINARRTSSSVSLVADAIAYILSKKTE